MPEPLPASTKSNRRLPTTFTHREARLSGISQRQLYVMLDAGTLERIGHGLYRFTASTPADIDLIEVAIRSPKATLCLLTALARHELTDHIPNYYDVAIPRGTTLPKTTAPVHWHRFDATTFELGRDTIDVGDGLRIGLYDPPRCIIDAYRMRSNVGTDVAVEALKRWLRGGGQPSLLLRRAKPFPHALPAIRQALEVLL